ncbi:MAG TPA: Crp/Fnr family transcriptional regulator [Acidobacteriaceae bacterium]|nr:Crp/Fnr family transcriptional regulator [Acidobacteriaceae bacterium]
MTGRRFRNTILDHLDNDAIDRVHLQPIQLPLAHVLQRSGGRIEHIFFVEDGIASMTTVFEDGSQVEAGMYGFEAAIGAPALMGVVRANNQIAMQLPGHGYRTTKEAAEREFRRGEVFHDLVLRYAQSQSVQTSQAAGCNIRHNVLQRLSRWLLVSRDRVTTDSMQFTQEFLAAMLGVARPAVNAVARQLQERALIRYSRGRVEIVDRAGLERATCECYWKIRGDLEAFREYADQRVSSLA